MKSQCKLCSHCDLFNGKVNISEDTRIIYKCHYCLGSQEKWKECKRFIFSAKHGFCPEFVMPNSLMSFDQILSKANQEYSYSGLQY